MAIVLNSLDTPPASRIAEATRSPMSLRCTWPGTNCVYELAIATIGLPKSPEPMPVARHRARAPAMLRPWVEVAERSGRLIADFSFAGSAPPRSGARQRYVRLTGREPPV